MNEKIYYYSYSNRYHKFYKYECEVFEYNGKGLHKIKMIKYLNKDHRYVKCKYPRIFNEILITSSISVYLKEENDRLAKSMIIQYLEERNKKSQEKINDNIERIKKIKQFN